MAPGEIGRAGLARHDHGRERAQPPGGAASRISSPEGRDAEPVRDPPRLDQLGQAAPDRPPPPLGKDAASRPGRASRRARPPSCRTPGRDQQEGGDRRGVALQPGSSRGEQAGARHHHPLRPAGRAGGVEHVGRRRPRPASGRSVAGAGDLDGERDPPAQIRSSSSGQEPRRRRRSSQARRSAG